MKLPKQVGYLEMKYVQNRWIDKSNPKRKREVSQRPEKESRKCTKAQSANTTDKSKKNVNPKETSKHRKEQELPASDKGSKKGSKEKRGPKGTPKAKTAQKGQPKKRKSRQDEDNPFLNRVSPHVVCDFVAKLDNIQKNAVREIGFGHLLDIKFERFDDPDLCKYLLDNYE
ncbi:OLC1v1000771C1 [Oldenlandia corymbosa var. corymbosa]|uniref:OLC1v1000771C1 n=1 Tax=Oldenlandia corymbosa var. corymbosa TaxID=529605 RepID=A0AAV1D3J4_OLDCO|nr:OLC1v1000771C1 [Oldenlandia corymbosa var. corymbosa]